MDLRNVAGYVSTGAEGVGDGQPDRATLLTELSEAQRLQALDRFGMLRPCLEDGVPLAEIARQRGLPVRSLERWLHGYRKRGLAGLARAPRRTRGQRHLPTQLQDLIEGLALRRPRLSAAAIHREVAAVTKAHGWPAPSYSTIFTIVRGLAPDLVTLAHEGPKVYADRFELLYRREASRPNEMWHPRNVLHRPRQRFHFAPPGAGRG